MRPGGWPLNLNILRRVLALPAVGGCQTGSWSPGRGQWNPGTGGGMPLSQQLPTAAHGEEEMGVRYHPSPRYQGREDALGPRTD